MGNDIPAICCPVGKRKTHANGMGVHFTVRGKGSANWQAIYPTEYRCFIKEVSIMRSGCGSPHRGQSPSSVTQLPILTALHARSPTLFVLIIHDTGGKVNPPFHIFLLCMLRSNLEDFRLGLEVIHSTWKKNSKFCLF